MVRIIQPAHAPAPPAEKLDAPAEKLDAPPPMPVADHGNAAATPAASQAAPSQAAASHAAGFPGTQATAMPATTTLATVNSAAVRQTVAQPGIPEITDLPPAGNTATAGVPSSPAPRMPVNIPAERPGASYGYDPDYKTLRGKLEYSVGSRRWKLIYLPPDGAIDEYGGNAVIPDPSQLNGFEAGDFVAAQGTFAPPTAAGGAATFAIQRIQRQ